MMKAVALDVMRRLTKTKRPVVVARIGRDVQIHGINTDVAERLLARGPSVVVGVYRRGATEAMILEDLAT